MTAHESIAALMPLDEPNELLGANVHPTDWENPVPLRPYHLVVIGAGTAGLVTAAGAAGLGARVALIERELMGGDCLNVGCVPSKSIIRAGRVAATLTDAPEFGVNISAEQSSVDFAQVMQRMRRVRALISAHDSARRFADLGVDVYLGQASFVDEQRIRVRSDGRSEAILDFKKAVIATGARASVPPIKGLDSVDYLTNETLFSLTQRPDRLGVIGSGPIGSEMAQTFARFGTEVHVFDQASQILPREDEEAAALVANQLERDGVRLKLNSRVVQVEGVEGNRVKLSVKQAGTTDELVVDQLLVAAGRTPNTDGLELEAANVRYDETGVQVDDYMRTSNQRIFSAGDICSQYKFTHAADFQARAVIQNALFAVGPIGRKKASELLIPWATYTSPELAHVGKYEDQLREAGVGYDTYVQRLDEVDRAILDGQTQGMVKVLTQRGRDKILGATIVAEHAGDMISELTMAIQHGIGLSEIGTVIHPYPTQADAVRKLGDQYRRTKLTPFSQRILGGLRWINVGA